MLKSTGNTQQRASLAGLKAALPQLDAGSASFGADVGEADSPPAGDNWLHEPKVDGHRTLALFDGQGHMRLRTRSGNAPPDYFDAPLAPLRKVPHQMVLDGEIAVPDEQGITRLSDLHDAMRFKRSERLAYFAFDLLELDGEDLRKQPVEDRKARLVQLLGHVHAPRVLYVEHIVGRGQELFDAVVAAGGEGIVSKRLGSRYAAGPSTAWVKFKAVP